MRLGEYLQRLGRNIKRARMKAGLRQIDVYERTGLTYRHYQNIEAGRINCTIGTLCRVAVVLEVPIRELVEDCDSPRK
jgi:transcriptional regulator with XRE-family HTH domain